MSDLNTTASEARVNNARRLLEDLTLDDSTRKVLLRDVVADLETLTEQVDALRTLLAQAQPFLLHNGLLAQISMRGIAADPEYKAIAERTIERGTEHAVEMPSGVRSFVEGGQGQIGAMWPRSRSFRRDYVRTAWIPN